MWEGCKDLEKDKGEGYVFIRGIVLFFVFFRSLRF